MVRRVTTNHKIAGSIPASDFFASVAAWHKYDIVTQNTYFLLLAFRNYYFSLVSTILYTLRTATESSLQSSTLTVLALVWHDGHCICTVPFSAGGGSVVLDLLLFGDMLLELIPCLCV